MGCVTFILQLLNVVVWVSIDVWMWGLSSEFGLAGVFGIIAYFIGYAVSVEFTIAPRDFWVNPAIGIFIKKLGVANTMAIIVWAVASWLMGAV